MTDLNQFVEENLIAVIREDCLRQAQAAQTKLNEVVECLTDKNHLGALGAFAGLDEDIVGLKVFLTRIARLTVGQNNANLPEATLNPNQTPNKRRHE